jgi:hypothetical protein
MDLVLLGAAALVLVALTLWLVWRPSPETDVRGQEASPMMPQGDQFEDQYTSATADLSAGGVALATSMPGPTAQDLEPSPEPVLESRPAPSPPISASQPTQAYTPVEPETQRANGVLAPKKLLGAGAAALLVLGGAVGGLAYSRWQEERNKPLNRLRRRFR